jgi:phage/plasmid-associated DNA primase
MLPRPSFTDFTKKLNLVKQRQQYQFKTDYGLQHIAIDTNDVYQFDIDTVDSNNNPYIPDAYKRLCLTEPHFLSTTKKLPHIFVRVNEKHTKYKCLVDDRVELLSGQWSFCPIDTTVFNFDKTVKVIDKAIYSKYYNTHNHKQYKSNTNVNIDELSLILNNCISKSRADDYDSWLHIGMCLYNIDNDIDGTCFQLWNTFSQLSDKYEPGVCDTKWFSFNFNGGLNAATIYYFAKHDNPYEFNNIISKRVVDEIKMFDASHNALARIIYKLFKDDFVCATPDGKLWYYYNGHLWKEDVEHLHLRRYISNELLRHFDKAYQQIHVDAPIEDMDSDTASNTTLNIKKKKINKIRDKLKDHTSKKNIIAECAEFFYDEKFLSKIDANPNLLGFNNGVFHLKEKLFVPSNPSDYVSLSVGYDYYEDKNDAKYSIVDQYFKMLHPDDEQRDYYLKTIARQLYGDNGMELFHIHAGYNGSAGGGKTKSWEINKLCLGDYIQKFDIAYLVNTKRKDASAPSPEYKLWKGRRLLYCTEPNPGETINAGVMKDLTGGEFINYRLLFSNHFDEYIPQFKIHVMTNDLPQIDGTDEGVKRRARVLQYISKFTTNHLEINPQRNIFFADTEITYKYREDGEQRMEFIRYLLDHYDHTWKYYMTDSIKKSSEQYLADNDDIGRFVDEYLIKNINGFVTLKDIKEIIKHSDFKDIKSNTLKTRLERSLGVKCIDEKRIGKQKYKNLFLGYQVKSSFKNDDSDE